MRIDNPKESKSRNKVPRVPPRATSASASATAATWPPVWLRESGPDSTAPAATETPPAVDTEPKPANNRPSQPAPADQSTSEPQPAPGPAASQDTPMSELIEWFVSNVDNLPREPFWFHPHTEARDPSKFYACLRREIAEGPLTPRVRLGTLQSDLARLRELFGGQ